MLERYPWLGDLHSLGIGKEYVGLICVVISAVCGMLVGFERERRDKPAGLRTMILISVGSTIFTMVSFLVASTKTTADPARLAAQILPGIGFLGAGAIIHSRGTVLGLTTGATIWTVAAVGVTIGAGYVAAGACFTMLIYITLAGLHRFEWIFVGRCRHRRTAIVYRPGAGKVLPRIQEVLDRYRIADGCIGHGRRKDDELVLDAPVCTIHRHHRLILKELAEIDEVLAIEPAESEGGRPAAGTAA